MSPESSQAPNAQLLELYDYHAKVTRGLLRDLSRLGYDGSVQSLPPMRKTKNCPNKFTEEGIHVPVREWLGAIGREEPSGTLNISVIGMPGAGKTTAVSRLGDTVGDMYIMPEQKPMADIAMALGGEINELIEDLPGDGFDLANLLALAETRCIEPDIDAPGDGAMTYKEFIAAESLKTLGMMEVSTAINEMRAGEIPRAPILLDRGDMIDGPLMKVAFLLTHALDGSDVFTVDDQPDPAVFDALTTYLNGTGASAKKQSFQAVAFFLTSPEVSLQRRPPGHITSSLFRTHLYYQYLSLYAYLRKRVGSSRTSLAFTVIDAEQDPDTVYAQFLKFVMYTRAVAGFPL
ncbi:MAG: hypothetical protein ACE5DX_04140 [Candidatus Dojkabacteria bacterium]